MDTGTLVGIVLGIGLIVTAIIMGGTMGSFLNAPGLMVVFGGTLAATLIMQRLKFVLGAAKVGLNAVFDRGHPVETTIETLANLATIVRKEGMLALENEKVSDPFLAKGIRLAVDGMSPELIRATLSSERNSLRRRHYRGQQLFRFMGTTAPSMGMIGTLIGLVQMLQTLDDPSSIGPSMAVALLTTFYGAVLAFLLMIPVANKLESRTEEESASMTVVIEGLDSLVRGENPTLLRQKLETYLSPRERNRKQAKPKPKTK